MKIVFSLVLLGAIFWLAGWLLRIGVEHLFDPKSHSANVGGGALFALLVGTVCSPLLLLLPPAPGKLAVAILGFVVGLRPWSKFTIR